MTNLNLGDITTTTLMEDAMSVMGSKDVKQMKQVTALIHTEKEDFAPMQVIFLESNANYYSQTGEQIFVGMLIATGDYQWRILPYAENLEITITITWLDRTGKIDYKRKPSNIRYKAILDTNSNPLFSNDTMSNKSMKELNLLPPLTINFELIDRCEELLRLIQIDGNYRNINTEDMLRSVFAHESNKFKVDGKPIIQGLEIDKPDNDTKFGNLLIPSGVFLRDLAGYLQEKSNGVYNAGIGSFFQRYEDKPFWFVYPLYKPERFEEDRQKLVIYAVPSEKFPNFEITFRKEGKILYVVSTGDKKLMDDRKNHQLNKGSGFRMTDLDAIMRKPVVIENDKIVAKRNRLNYEVVSKERKDKINFAPTVNVESNPLLEVSRIRASELSKVSFVWDNSDHTLIIPGMPIKYVYMHRGKYTEAKGTVVMAKHRIQLQGNPGVDSVYKSSSSITALIESTNDTPDNPKENFIGRV